MPASNNELERLKRLRDQKILKCYAVSDSVLRGAYSRGNGESPRSGSG